MKTEKLKSAALPVSVPEKLRERIDEFCNAHEFKPSLSKVFIRAMIEFLDRKDAEAKKPVDSK